MHLLLTETLFAIVRTWKQPKRPREEWLKKLWYIYTTQYYSAIKNKIVSFAEIRRKDID